jgi:hypothetical protein
MSSFFSFVRRWTGPQSEELPTTRKHMNPFSHKSRSGTSTAPAQSSMLRQSIPGYMLQQQKLENFLRENFRPQKEFDIEVRHNSQISVSTFHSDLVFSLSRTTFTSIFQKHFLRYVYFTAKLKSTDEGHRLKETIYWL